MSSAPAAKRTKIFGMDLGVDPKVVALLLVVAAVAIYYFTSSSEAPSGGSATPSASVSNQAPPGLTPTLRAKAAAARRASKSQIDHGPLKLVPVDGSRGDVDPTLRLRLLDRVKDAPPAEGLRNLFDTGPAVAAQNLPPLPKNIPKLPPGPLPNSTPMAMNTAPVAPPFSIPLKYYGFVKPIGHDLDGSRGFFMDGDNILVGAEGDVLETRFLIVALTPGVARLEDTQAKQGQDVQVTPEAPTSQ